MYNYYEPREENKKLHYYGLKSFDISFDEALFKILIAFSIYARVFKENMRWKIPLTLRFLSGSHWNRGISSHATQFC
jgi:hypothetical protein